jgi:hypothetical protein
VPLIVMVAPTRPLAGTCEMVGLAAMQSDALVEPVPTVDVPAGHCVAAVAPAVSTYVSSGASRQLAAPGSGLNVPRAQGVAAWAPVVSTKEPAGASVHEA